eukprot:TCALIF_12006-PA protein Name:"Protein of unknown function" AED:0.32 eAED:0.32 QI:0/0.5/0/0.66/1/1/3/0/427
MVFVSLTMEEVEAQPDMAEEQISLEKHKVSPLLPLKKFLRISRLAGGFPIKFKDDTLSEFRFEKFAYIYLMSCACLLGFNLMSIGLIAHLKGRPLWRMVDFLRDCGMSTTDGVASIALYLPTMVLTIWFAINYIKAGELTTEFCQKFLALKGIHILEVDFVRIYGRTLRRIQYIYVCVFASTTLISFIYGQIIIPGASLDFATVMFYIIFFIDGLFVYFPLIIAASFAILSQVLGALNLALEQYNQIILDKLYTPPNPANSGDEDDMILLGNQIVDILEFTNTMYGPMLIFEYTECIIFIVIGYFFGISMFTVLEDGLRLVPFLNGLACFLIGVSATLRVYGHNSGGQKLCRQTTKARRNLQKYVSHKFWTLSAESANNYELQVKYLSKPAPIRPMDIFDLNWSSALSLNGLMLTYIIVLLQFKLGE